MGFKSKISWYKKAQVEDEPKVEEVEDDLAWLKDKWVPVKSSWITDVAYCEGMGFFEVRLANGREYTFEGVPKRVYEDFLESKSKGEFFNRVIRANYGKK